MPLDFRTYTDPGVYIEVVAPPIIFNPAIEPTILAIVGDAPTSRSVNESTLMFTTSPSQLTTLGGRPSTVRAANKLLGTPYVSAALGALTVATDNDDTTLTVQTYDGIILPATPFSATIQNEQLNVTNVSSNTWTVSRAQNSTTGAEHGLGQVLNLLEAYNTNPSIKVASLAFPISSTTETVVVYPSYVVQTVWNDASGGDFTLTYDGQTTANINYNANAAAVKSALVALSNIGTNDLVVTGAGTSGNPWVITFVLALESNTVKLIPDDTGLTGDTLGTSVFRRGAANNTYLDVEGERMAVTAAGTTSVTADSSQTLTVVRGVAGTPPKTHGAVLVTENTGADYKVSVGAGPDSTIGSLDDTMFLATLDSVRIPNGTSLSVSFDVSDSIQFSPSLFDDIDTVKDKFGAPFTSDGQINSPLSLGAQLAFLNGATRLVLVAANPDDDNPIQDAINKLALEPIVNEIVILSGSSGDIDFIRGHVDSVSEQGLLRRAFVGLNGLSSPPPNTNTLITQAQQISDERVVLVGPSQFLANNGTDNPILLPGFYAAAAVAGRHAGLLPQEPLTRKQIYGFVGINDQDSSGNVLTAQSYGVMMLFEDRFGRLIIKHGLTTDITSLYTRELSVGTARDRLRDMISETLDQAELIGSPMTETTPNLVMSGVSSALEEAVSQGLIFGYNDVKFRIPPTNPTLIEVRFAYKPTLPLNYIIVQFSIDTNAGSLDFQNINEEPTA